MHSAVSLFSELVDFSSLCLQIKRASFRKILSANLPFNLSSSSAFFFFFDDFDEFKATKKLGSQFSKFQNLNASSGETILGRFGAHLISLNYLTRSTKLALISSVKVKPFDLSGNFD